MGVASWLWLSGLLMGLGRLGAAPAERGQLVVSRGCVARGCGWLSVVGIGNTPAVVVGRCGCCGRGGLLVVGVPCVFCACGGGMLSGFWGSAPWLPGLCSAALCGWWGVGVGGLVVNCIVDASILL